MVAVALALSWYLALAAFNGSPTTTLYVDAAASPGGTGTKKAPYARITDALDAGRALAGTHEVAIAVAAGDYVNESRPLVLDYPVSVMGATELARDGDGLATGEALNATTVLGLATNERMIVITGNRVKVRGLRLYTGSSSPIGTGIVVDKASDFRLLDVHLAGFATGIITSASSGHLFNSFLGPPLDSAVLIGGGDSDRRSDVRVSNNRVVDYSAGGITLVAADPVLPREKFDSVAASVDRNHFSTDRPISGPSNPYGLRLDPINTAFAGSDSGTIEATVADNTVEGNHRYPLIVNGGQVQRDGRHYSAVIDLTLRDNLWLAGAGTVSRILISFTNSRMSLAPFWNELATSTQYVQNSRYELRHYGELETCVLMDPTSADCRVDHPEVEPCDGRVLDNVLALRGPTRALLPYATFIPDVCPDVASGAATGGTRRTP